MENCCGNLFGWNKKHKLKPKKLMVLKRPTGGLVGLESELEREEIEIALERALGRGYSRTTYLCKDRKTGEELVYTYEDDDDVHLIMELCEGDSLFDRIVARGHYFERTAAYVFKTIVQVVQMCHQHGVMHRDIKPENFLFADKKELGATLKVTDFRLSTFFKPGERFNEIVGSPYYVAPEVLKRNYGPEIDIWSAGVTLYILLCGIPPFWAETEQGVAQAIIRSFIDFTRVPWPRVSDNAKDLVKKMLDPDPKHRLTAQEVLDHPWLQNAKTAPTVSLGE